MSMFAPSWYRHVRRPWAEPPQDNNWNGWPRGPDEGPRRSAPREMPFKEWNPHLRVWHQGPNILRNFKPNYYLTRPHDGKRPGTLGRFKDALTGEGPDVFLTVSGDKRTLMRDRPQRSEWAGWGLSPREWREREDDKDFRFQDDDGIAEAPWTGKKRAWKQHYNFRSRKYESPLKVAWNPDRVWTDARWPEGARHNSRMPLSYRDIDYEWLSRVPWWASYYAGGRPRR